MGKDRETPWSGISREQITDAFGVVKAFTANPSWAEVQDEATTIMARLEDAAELAPPGRKHWRRLLPGFLRRDRTVYEMTHQLSEKPSIASFSGWQVQHPTKDFGLELRRCRMDNSASFGRYSPIKIGNEDTMIKFEPYRDTRVKFIIGRGWTSQEYGTTLYNYTKFAEYISASHENDLVDGEIIILRKGDHNRYYMMIVSPGSQVVTLEHIKYPQDG